MAHEQSQTSLAALGREAGDDHEAEWRSLGQARWRCEADRSEGTAGGGRGRGARSGHEPAWGAETSCASGWPWLGKLPSGGGGCGCGGGTWGRFEWRPSSWAIQPHGGDGLHAWAFHDGPAGWPGGSKVAAGRNAGGFRIGKGFLVQPVLRGAVLERGTTRLGKRPSDAVALAISICIQCGAGGHRVASVPGGGPKPGASEFLRLPTAG
mmetsp:Transcript_14180/g.53280  ORF Transcript_14180/g.53280 Transcript_14180/m.53280 type:complete len:209 (-) Transcript_14180:636-1262(-)